MSSTCSRCCAPPEWEARRARWRSCVSQAGTIRGLTDVLLELEGSLGSRSPIVALTGDRWAPVMCAVKHHCAGLLNGAGLHMCMVEVAFNCRVLQIRLTG